MKYSWANLSIQFYVYESSFLYGFALVSMIEALVNFYSPGIPFVLISAGDCIIHSKWFVLCGIYAFRWENENGHELYWKLHKCTLCISAHAHLHIDAAVQIDIWPHRTIKNYHTSSILFWNCITFLDSQKHMDITRVGAGECAHWQKSEWKEEREKTNAQMILQLLSLNTIFLVFFFPSFNVRFALFLPLQCYCCARIVLFPDLTIQ